MIEVFAPAKINLYLHVTGKRDDGYHLLDSLFCFASIGDDILVEKSDELGFNVSGEFADELKDCANNSIIKAATLLKDKYQIKAGAKISLKKNLPIASGIGGGSADAAATLLALKDLWELDIKVKDLEDIALKIGADVPACLYRDALQVSGIGEEIVQLEAMPETHILLVNPLKCVSTPAVFKNRYESFSYAMPFTNLPNNIKSLVGELKLRANDLYLPALLVEPEVKTVVELISTTKGCLLARMSGSGATCFGLYKNGADAQAALEAIKAKKPHWWAKSGYLL